MNAIVSDWGKPRPNLKDQEKLFLRVSVYNMDSAIHHVNLYPVDSAIGFLRRGIHQEIYRMESSIQLLNNWGLDESRIVSVH